MGIVINRNRYSVLALGLMMVITPFISADIVLFPNGEKGTDGPMDGSGALPSFTNVSALVGLAGKAGSFFSWGDYNNDGYMDFLVNGKFLYENGGPPGYMFSDVTLAKGLSSAGGKGVWGDLDNDGDLDLYVASVNDRLFQNQGPPNFDFVDVTISAGNVRDSYPGTAASWGDLDNDGDLDLYVVNGETGSTYEHFPDTLWMNNGNGTFTNVTSIAGVDTSLDPKYGRGAIWGDYDNDGWQDIYISNYRIDYNYLYVNNRNGTFTDRGKELNAAGFGRTGNGKPGGDRYGHTIGSSFADLNNDGRLDIFVSNLAHKDPDRGRYCDDSNIYINNGFPYWNFSDIRSSSGIPIKPIGGVTHGYYNDENWANAAIADFDNDGYLDIYIPQVYKFSWMYSYLYHNQGNSTWKNVSDVLGLHNVVDTYAGAWADYDNDGDMDLLTAGRENQWNQTDITSPVEIRLFRNEGNANNYLKVDLTGVESNKHGVGARVYLKIGKRLLMQQVETGMGSHGQQNDIRLHFGLGSATTVDSLKVVWPSGIIQVLKNVAYNQQVNITENVTGPRIISFSASPSRTAVDQDVTITSEVSGPIDSYSWDLEGDGTFDRNSGSNQAQTFTVRGPWEYHPTLEVMDGPNGVGFIKSAKVIVNNVPPVAKIGPDVIVNEDEEIRFDASGTLDTLWDRDNLTFQYFFGDGSNTTPTKVEWVNHSYPLADLYTVILQVSDPFGGYSTDEVDVTVNNVVPTVTMITNTSVEEDAVLAFNATGNDTISDSAIGLDYRWDFDDGTTTGWDPDPYIQHTYTTSGDYTVSVGVRDDDGEENYDTKVITVYNKAPGAKLEITKYYIDEDSLVTLDGFGNDTPSDLAKGLEYKWDFGDGNVTDWGSMTQVTHMYTHNGTYIAKFMVKDAEGVEVNDTAEVNVYNLLPFASIIETPAELVEDVEGDFLGLGIDTPTDQLSLLYKWDFGDGTDSGWMRTPDTTHNYTQEGDLLVGFFVMDNDKEVAMTETEIVVINPVPDIRISSPVRTYFLEDDRISFIGEGNDNPSDNGILVFSWTINGLEYMGKEVKVTFSNNKTVEAVFRAQDDEGAFSEETMSLTIGNIVPSVRITQERSTIFEGDSMIFEANVTDSVSDIDNITYSWDCDKNAVGTNLTTPRATCTFNIANRYKVKVTVMDDEGAVGTSYLDVIVLSKDIAISDHTGGDDIMMLATLGGVFLFVIMVLWVIIYLLRRRSRKGIPIPREGGAVKGPKRHKMDIWKKNISEEE